MLTLYVTSGCRLSTVRTLIFQTLSRSVHVESELGLVHMPLAGYASTASIVGLVQRLSAGLSIQFINIFFFETKFAQFVQNWL